MPNLALGGSDARRLVAVLAAMAVCLIAAPGAKAATTVGETFAPDPSSNCPAEMTFAQNGVEAPYYTMPSPGVITSWSHLAGAVPVEMKLKVLRGVFAPSLFVGESSFALIPATTLGTFQTRIEVQEGDQLGLYIKSPLGGVDCTGPVNFELTYALYFAAGDHTSGSMSYSSAADRRLDLAATLEPDADGDGFGDETQDQCPTDAGTQGACPGPDPDPETPDPPDDPGTPDPPDDPETSDPPDGSGTSSPRPGTSSSGTSNPPLPDPADVDPPETSFKKVPATAVRKRRAAYRFLADEPEAQFQCKLDRKPWKSCRSPLTLPGLEPGKRAFKVRAIDKAGNVDASPARDWFRVLD